jgi:protein transport protein SEC61 subunit gamma-like protein
MSDVNAHIIQPLKKFAKDSTHLVKKCTKPDRKGKPHHLPSHVLFLHSSLITPVCSRLVPPEPLSCTEFARIAYATSVGFLIMGFIGFFVKLIHIPINNILLGGI